MKKSKTLIEKFSSMKDTSINAPEAPYSYITDLIEEPERSNLYLGFNPKSIASNIIGVRNKRQASMAIIEPRDGHFYRFKDIEAIIKQAHGVVVYEFRSNDPGNLYTEKDSNSVLLDVIWEIPYENYSVLLSCSTDRHYDERDFDKLDLSAEAIELRVDDMHIHYAFPEDGPELVKRFSTYFKSSQEKFPEESSRTVHILTFNRGFDTVRREVKSKFDIPDLDLYYSNEMGDFHDKFIERIKINHGISIFHGQAGTGKTSYIRHLLKFYVDAGKQVLLIPTGFAGNLSSPDFASFLLNWCSNSKNGTVLIIEDADSALQKQKNRSAAVSSLLNLTDGIMNDLTNVSVLATINMPVSEIDPAILRNGRLIASREFELLTPDQATALALSLDVKHDFNAPTSIADIFSVVNDLGIL